MLPPGKKSPSSPPLELFTMDVLCLVHLYPLCRLMKYTIVGTALSPGLAMVMQAIDPGEFQEMFSPGYWHGST